ncbi:hypothetical protein NMG60_11009956 [Bertholletia excelsa]
MAFKLNHMLLVLSVLAAVGIAVANGSNKEAIVGGWQVISNLKDPAVQVMAQFAISEHNKEAGTDLKYDSVVKGEYQVVSGTNYRLVLAATDSGVAGQYEALVYDNPWEHIRSLVSFKKV